MLNTRKNKNVEIVASKFFLPTCNKKHNAVYKHYKKLGNKRFELMQALSYWVYSSAHITNYGSFLV